MQTALIRSEDPKLYEIMKLSRFKEPLLSTCFQLQYPDIKLDLTERCKSLKQKALREGKRGILYGQNSLLEAGEAATCQV